MGAIERRQLLDIRRIYVEPAAAELPRGREVLGELDDAIAPATRRQLAAEVIFLTHNDRLHEVNLGWHPKAE
ncbi:MAG: radical protein, partial [Nonomuraea muscovyensis]|nr:radical protein [Nonomuraea muscovyensis]